MTSDKSTLIRVREAQDALDKARAAMDSIQSGLSTVEAMAEKAESAREHPMRTGGVFLLVVLIILGALFGIKSLSE